MNRLIFTLALLFCFSAFSQEEVKFSKNSDFYLKGNAVLIGNNILSKHEKKAFSDFSTINDLIHMRYVDVDKVGSTFSSSSASLNIKHPDVKIKKAVLYWTAIYPYSSGKRKVKDNDQYYYHKLEDRKGDFTQVELKIPSSKSYTSIQGNVIFDGFEKEGYEENAPYACYADVTNILRQSKDINGEYTVANVRATQGFVSGGGTAGWFLYIVYESDAETSKYITSYNGFASLSNNNVDIEFNDFVTKSDGEVKASVMVAALEGDGKLSQDQCAIYNSKTNKYQLFKNKNRSIRNFFNGKITRGNSYYTARNPKSINTLGFDLLEIDIPTNVLSNNQKNTTLRLSSKADRYFFYFAAFKTEIKKEFHYKKIEEELLVENTEEVKKDAESVSDISETELKSVIGDRRLEIPEAKSGYYIITNVFSVKSNAEKWRDFLISKGHEAKIFVNPKNNWHYVSTYNDFDVYEVYKKHQTLAKLDYFKEIWVFKINLE